MADKNYKNTRKNAEVNNNSEVWLRINYRKLYKMKDVLFSDLESELI
jgi:hypothetical protein